MAKRRPSGDGMVRKREDGRWEGRIRPGLGEKRVTQIKSTDIQKFYDKLGQKLASGSVRRIHTVLHGIMKAAQQARLIPRNPVDDVAPPKFSY